MTYVVDVVFPLAVQALAVIVVQSFGATLAATSAAVMNLVVSVPSQLSVVFALVLLGGRIKFVPSYVSHTTLPTAISPSAGSSHSYVFIDFAVSALSVSVHAHVFATSALNHTFIPVVYAVNAGVRFSA
mgnify:CR=1 FL=1